MEHRHRGGQAGAAGRRRGGRRTPGARRRAGADARRGARPARAPAGARTAVDVRQNSAAAVHDHHPDPAVGAADPVCAARGGDGPARDADGGAVHRARAGADRPGQRIRPVPDQLAGRSAADVPDDGQLRGRRRHVGRHLRAGAYAVGAAARRAGAGDDRRLRRLRRVDRLLARDRGHDRARRAAGNERARLFEEPGDRLRRRRRHARRAGAAVDPARVLCPADRNLDRPVVRRGGGARRDRGRVLSGGDRDLRARRAGRRAGAAAARQAGGGAASAPARLGGAVSADGGGRRDLSGHLHRNRGGGDRRRRRVHRRARARQDHAHDPAAGDGRDHRDHGADLPDHHRRPGVLVLDGRDRAAAAHDRVRQGNGPGADRRAFGHLADLSGARRDHGLRTR